MCHVVANAINSGALLSVLPESCTQRGKMQQQSYLVCCVKSKLSSVDVPGICHELVGGRSR